MSGQSKATLFCFFQYVPVPVRTVKCTGKKDTGYWCDVPAAVSPRRSLPAAFSKDLFAFCAVPADDLPTISGTAAGKQRERGVGKSENRYGTLLLLLLLLAAHDEFQGQKKID